MRSQGVGQRAAGAAESGPMVGGLEDQRWAQKPRQEVTRSLLRVKGHTGYELPLHKVGRRR